jgi:DNA repair exonuclease SbcCD ATPase subunit
VKIRAIRLWNVRRFADKGIAIEDIGDGVNVLAAENERGKSTCFDALHALLFQPHSANQKILRMLRPYSGGSPRIEADIETDAGFYRIAKQYFSGKEATVTDLSTHRLVAQADQAEAWITNLTNGGATGPTGLLWVRQGITDFDSGGKPQQEQEQKVREDALSSVAGEEVEALTGGRRMAWIHERCKAELAELVTTTGQARKAGVYAEAKEKLVELQTEERTRKEQVNGLRDALDQRKSKLARRTELMDPATVESQRREVRRTEEALEKAKTHTSQLTEAFRRQEIETSRHAFSLEALNRYREDAAQSKSLATKLAAAEKAHDEAVIAQGAAQKAEDAAVRALRDAETKHTAAREQHRRAAAAGRVGDARKQLEGLKTRLENAEGRRAAIEQLSAKTRTISIPQNAVEKLESLMDEISRLRARAEASAALVSVDHGANPHGTVLVDGTPMADGESHSVPRSAHFDIAGVGTLTVSTGSGSHETIERTLLTKQVEHDQQLEDLGVTSLSALRDRKNTLAALHTDLKAAKAELGAWAPDGIDVLKVELTRLDDLINDHEGEDLDLDQAAEDLEAAETRVGQARVEAETARADLSNRRGIALEAKLKVDHLRQDIDTLGKTLGPEAERLEKLQELEQAAARYAAGLDTSTRQVDVLKANAPDLESVEAATKLAASAAANVATESARLEQEIGVLTGLIRARSEDAAEENLAETIDRRVSAEERVTALETEIAVLKRLEKALNEARAAAQEQYLGPVMDELRPLLSLVFDDANITFDDNTLLPRSLERNGQDEDISVLSGGMREQLTVLTRLAFARLLAKSGRPVPVILDDALVYSDDDRIEKMFVALHRQARDLQIIVFSCRQRAFDRLGGHGLRMTDWAPS